MLIRLAIILLSAALFVSCHRIDTSVLMQQSVAAARQGRYEDALRDTAACLKVNPEHVDALLLNSYCSFLTENTENARKQALYNLAKCTRLAPSSFDVWYFYGWALVESRHTRDAIEPLERAYSLLPKSGGPRPQVQLLLGRCYAENNIQNKALSNLQALQFRKPYNTWPELYNMLGILALRRLQTDMAVSFFKRGLEFEPEHEVLLQNLAVTYDLYRNDVRTAKKYYIESLAVKARRQDEEGQLRLQNRLRQLSKRK